MGDSGSGANVSQMQVNDRLVAQYLHARGFRQAEAHLRAEARLSSAGRSGSADPQTLPPDARGLDEASIPNFVLFYNEAEANNPGALEHSYARLRRWIGDSIDAYRLELQPVLFPIFVNAYLDLIRNGQREAAARFFDNCKTDHVETHGPDLARLSGIVNPLHLSENDYVKAFRQNKYGIKMSKYAFELLLGFLQDNRFMLLLRIINQYVSIQAVSERPDASAAAAKDGDESAPAKTAAGERDDGAGLIGPSVSHLDAFNAQPVRLGRLPPDVAFLKDVERALAQQRDGDADDLRRQLESIIKTQPDADAPEIAAPEAADAAEMQTDFGTSGGAQAVPLPPRRRIDIQEEIEHLRDLKNQIRLGPSSLPSICCFTFHNAHGGIASLRASASAEMLAAGFSDSFIKLWSRKPIGNNPSGSVSSSSINAPPTTLVGHSGPVFGLDFSPRGDYLLSASEDKTVRLWSVHTRSNLVVYKGHNYPVFDVSFGPYGLYFATASYDRTARLWSCDHLFPLRMFVGHLADVSAVRFHPNSNYVVTGSADRTCRMWDVQRGACVRIFSRQATASGGSAITTIAVSPDGRTMASASDDRAIRLWDLGSGRRIKTMYGHAARVHSLEFSRDGAMLASGGADDSVRLWDVKRADVHEMSVMDVDRTMSGQPNSAGVRASALGLDESVRTNDQIAAYPTKRTPIYNVQFTPRNLLLALGVFESL